jgi:PPOX class probable F420-dependent enzyme
MDETDVMQGERKPMIPQEMQDLLTQRNNAIIAVNRPTGGPQVTPVWYLWDGEAFYFSTTKDRAKYAHIKRNPAISLIVDGGPRYIAAYGQAEIIEQITPDLADLAVQMAAKYVPPEGVEQLVKLAQEPGRVVIKLRPEKVVVR